MSEVIRAKVCFLCLWAVLPLLEALSVLESLLYNPDNSSQQWVPFPGIILIRGALRRGKGWNGRGQLGRKESHHAVCIVGTLIICSHTSPRIRSSNDKMVSLQIRTHKTPYSWQRDGATLIPVIMRKSETHVVMSVSQLLCHFKISHLLCKKGE